MTAKDENNSSQAFPYNKEAIQKYVKSLEKILPLLDEMKKAIKVMQARAIELETIWKASSKL